MDVSPAKNILYITHRVPYPPDKGDRIRTFHTLRYLAKYHRVHLACLADEPVSLATQEVLNQLCEQVAIVPIQSGMRQLKMAWSIVNGSSASLTAFRSKNLKEIIEGWEQEIGFDFLLASSSSTAPYLTTPRFRKIPVVVDLVDVDSEKWLNYASATSFPKSWIYQREGKALRKYEREISSWARAVLLVSEAESQLFRTLAPTAQVHTVSNGVDLDYFQPAESSLTRNQSCVFVGALDYPPNIDAVCWFADHVWPVVFSKYPDARFQIVGRRPVAAVLGLSRIAGIEVIGQVPDVRPYVHKAAVVVAPLRIARGLQNKVLEAMSMAKPVVASPAALGGLHPDIRNPAVRVESVTAWVSELEKLFANQKLVEELGRQGREYVETHYHWDQCLAPLQSLLESSTRKKTFPTELADGVAALA